MDLINKNKIHPSDTKNFGEPDATQVFYFMWPYEKAETEAFSIIQYLWDSDITIWLLVTPWPNNDTVTASS